MSSNPRKLRVISVLASVARGTGGPAVSVIQGTSAMRGAVDRRLYTTDAAVPASTRRFRRLLDSDLPSGAEDVTINVYKVWRPYTTTFSPGLARALTRSVAEADLVTIHSINLFPQFAAYWAARRAGTPYIVTPHGALDPWLRQNSSQAKAINNALWQRRMLTEASAIHFTTEEERDLARDLTDPAPTYVVPNGIDDLWLQQSGSATAFRDRWLGGDPGAIVLFVGRISRKKGIDLLIRGFAAGCGEHDATLVIAGPDDEELTPELRRVAASAGVHKRVRFIGPVYGADHRDALAAATVWALTSHTENFGNAVLEAMAAGCPVIVSTEVNLAAQIEAARAGVITRCDHAEIGATIAGLLGDADRRRQLSERAADFARTFDWRVVAPKLVSMFEEVAHRRRAS